MADSTASPWQGLINALLHELQFCSVLDEKAVEEFASYLVTETLLDLTPEQEYALLSDALRSDAQLTGFFPEPHGEEALRRFLRRLLERMEEKRPWPEAAYRRLPVAHWEDFSGVEPIARIGMRYVRVEECLGKAFRTVAAGDRRLSVLVLRLRSGEEVALAGPWWPESNDVALLGRDPGRAEETVAAFLDATPIGTGDVVLVSR